MQDDCQLVHSEKSMGYARSEAGDAAGCRYWCGTRAPFAACTRQPRCFLALRGFTLAMFEFLYRLSFFGLTTLGLYGFFDADSAVDVNPQLRASARASVRNFMSLDTTNWPSGTSTSSENSDPSRESPQLRRSARTLPWDSRPAAECRPHTRARIRRPGRRCAPSYRCAGRVAVPARECRLPSERTCS